MIAEIKKSSSNSQYKKAVIQVPPSKSHSIRAVLLAAFANAPSQLENILLSGDTKTAFSVINKLGAEVCFYKNDENLNSVKIIPPKHGILNYLSKKDDLIIDCGNSGSVFYFLGSALSILPIDFILTGDSSICTRPIAPLLEIYDQLNIQYEFLSNSETAPIKVYGSKRENHKEKIYLSGIFSQPITGLLLASVFFDKSIEINLSRAGELPYLCITAEWLNTCGIKYTVNADFTNFKIYGGQNIKPIKKLIPADWSSAAFPITAAVVSNKDLELTNLDINDVQGDKKIISILKKMGATIYCNPEEKKIHIKASLKNLKGGVFDCSDIPDTVPALSAISCFISGKTILKNIEICRYKECDRISVICSELKKIGADINEGKDFLIINGTGGQNLHTAVTDSNRDHRIGLMLAALSAGISFKDSEVFKIFNADCFDISYPEFINDIKKLNVNISLTD